MVVFGGPWWLVVDVIAVAISGTAIAYGVISWRESPRHAPLLRHPSRAPSDMVWLACTKSERRRQYRKLPYDRFGRARALSRATRVGHPAPVS
jgi:hypothetical protein